MKKITHEKDIPTSFFVGFLHVVRGSVDTRQLIEKPNDLREINGKEIFVLKPGCDPRKFRSYEKYLVQLNISNKKAFPEIFPTKERIEHKRRKLLEQERYAFHFLNKIEFDRLFKGLQHNPKAMGHEESSLELELVARNRLQHPVELAKGGQIPDLQERLNKLGVRGGNSAVQFYTYINYLLKERNVVLDLEFSQGKSQKLIDFDTYIQAVEKEGYHFDISQLMPIRKRLGLKSREDVLDYFRGLSNRLAIVSATFNVKSYGDQSGYYEVYFVHPDSAQVDRDILVSALIPKTEILPDFRAHYNIPARQTFNATIVGNITGGLDSLVDGKYMVSIVPIAIY